MDNPKLENSENSPVSDQEDERKMSILKKRASLLANIPESIDEKGIQLVGLSFILANEHYIIDTTYVVEVLLLKDFTPLPGTASFLTGIVNVRGRILSVVDLKTFLSLPDIGITNLNRLIRVKNNQTGIELCLLVDEVEENVIVNRNTLQEDLSSLTPAEKEYFIGITQKSEVVLDIEKFLADENIIINDEI